MRKNIAINKPSSDYPVAIPIVWTSAVFVVTLLSLVVTNFITRQLVGSEPTTAELFTTLLGIAIIGASRKLKGASRTEETPPLVAT